MGCKYNFYGLELEHLNERTSAQHGLTWPSQFKRDSNGIAAQALVDFLLVSESLSLTSEVLETLTEQKIQAQ